MTKRQKLAANANIRWDKFYKKKTEALAKKIQVVISDYVGRMYKAQSENKILQVDVLSVEIARAIINRKGSAKTVSSQCKSSKKPVAAKQPIRHKK